MTQIPDNARPTTPCDQQLAETSTSWRTCGNRWGTPWSEEPEYPECTECHHVCAHGADAVTASGSEQPFRFLTGPEIAARFEPPGGEFDADVVSSEWGTFSFTVPPQPVMLVVRANHWQEAGDALRHFVIPPEGVLLIPETIQPQENH